MQKIRSSNPFVIVAISDTEKNWAYHKVVEFAQSWSLVLKITVKKLRKKLENDSGE